MFNVKRVMELWQSLFDADDPLKPASERATESVDRLKEKPKVPSKTKKVVSKKTKHIAKNRKKKLSTRRRNVNENRQSYDGQNRNGDLWGN